MVTCVPEDAEAATYGDIDS
uniref:Uncharacterized protein n=1 Tax=Arundo donax TaxID=35708 RepID=A0A0A9BK80_ARUDO